MWRSVAHPGLRCARALTVTAVAVCSATSGASQPAPRSVQPPVITSFTIDDAADSVARGRAALLLSHVVAGSRPVEYRVGVRADFANAPWLPYAPPLRVERWQALVQDGARCDGRADGTRLQLFLQVRADMGGTVRIVNGQRVVVPQKVESNVLSDAICVTPDP